MALVSQLRRAGLMLTARGESLVVKPKDALTDELRTKIRANKATILAELTAEESGPLTATQEAAHRAVLARLTAAPYIQWAFVNRWDGDVMILTLAVRGVGTCELSIPRERFGADSLAEFNRLAACVMDPDNRA